jgi:hypothetical protein
VRKSLFIRREELPDIIFVEKFLTLEIAAQANLIKVLNFPVLKTGLNVLGGIFRNTIHKFDIAKNI